MTDFFDESTTDQMDWAPGAGGKNVGSFPQAEPFDVGTGGVFPASVDDFANAPGITGPPGFPE